MNNVVVPTCNPLSFDEKPRCIEEYRLIAALLRDAQALHSTAYSAEMLRLDLDFLGQILARDGMTALTSGLSRLGKAFDRALTGSSYFELSDWSSLLGGHVFSSGATPENRWPLFNGLLNEVLDVNGLVKSPCVTCIALLRQIMFVFYKYELPYSQIQEREVIQQFERTEDEIRPYNATFHKMARIVDCNPTGYDRVLPESARKVIRRARILLSRVFRTFDCRDIYPKHGPGAVSTGERLWNKYAWRNVPDRIARTYPIDEYYYSSLSHVCDRLETLQGLTSHETSAKVILVPKDARGPRLISCEPLEFQWIQQGLGQAIVGHVEKCPLTRHNIHFTDQRPNQLGALLGSLHGRYATLDLKEASDRVTVGLVQLLFPEPILTALLNTRSLRTQMPDGSIRKLRKFAPMGSALCFPVLALTVWAILHSCIDDADARDGILVYGDDVVVPSEQSERAMKWLELFGLAINRNKSCTSGLFRESCGMDAYNGHSVTPVRFRTVWDRRQSPSVYTSWISYANSCWRRQYFRTYDVIVEMLGSVYRNIPSKDMVGLSCPALPEVPESLLPKRWKINHALQKREWRVLDVKVPSIVYEIDGWSMLLRTYAEKQNQSTSRTHEMPRRCGHEPVEEQAFSASQYIRRNTSKLVMRWR